MKEVSYLVNRLFVLIAVVAIALESCSKEQPIGSPIPAVKGNTLRLDNRFANANDAEDEQIMDQLIMLTNGLRSFATQTALLDIIYNKTATTENHEVHYDSLISADAQFKTNMNAYLHATYFSNLAAGHDCYKDVKDAMVRRSVVYFPNIYVPNIATANQDELPYICNGASEVDDSDRIVAYEMKSDGSFDETLLNENDAISSTRPVIIVNCATCHIESTDTDSNYVNISESLSTPTDGDRMYYWESWCIHAGYRYENHGPSDVHGMATFYGQGINNYLVHWPDFTVGIHDSYIDHVSGTNVNNSTLYQNMSQQVFPNNLTAAQVNAYPYMHLTTYERDWYASTKLVQYCSTALPFGSPKIHSPRMRYSDEWYHETICNTDHRSYLPGINYVFAFGNIKSYFRIKRVL